MKTLSQRLLLLVSIPLTFSFSVSQGQSFIDDINFELIPYNSVITYIQNQKDHNIFKFTDIKPSWKEKYSEEDYSHLKKTYRFKQGLPEVWSKYRTTSPAESWNGKKVMFGFMFSKKKNQPLYSGDDFTEIDTGQVIFLNLKLLKFYDLAMAFEIISVDNENKIIEFSYIEGNTSRGKQSLQFIDTPRGHTKIVHQSYFKSESKLRDKFLYPFFHTRTTNEFHRIMKKLINNQDQ
jgi:hypothetical protein